MLGVSVFADLVILPSSLAGLISLFRFNAGLFVSISGCCVAAVMIAGVVMIAFVIAVVVFAVVVVVSDRSWGCVAGVPVGTPVVVVFAVVWA